MITTNTRWKQLSSMNLKFHQKGAKCIILEFNHMMIDHHKNPKTNQIETIVGKYLCTIAHTHESRPI